MTKEEAIKILHPISDEYCQIANIRMTQAEDDICEALDMAIKALKAEPCKDAISRQAAIEALDEQIEQCNKALGSFDISPKDEFAIKAERASLEAYKEQLENMPSAQPDRDVIDDCLCHIYKNISVHTATGGVIAIRYYMEKLYEEIYGEGEKPWWMT